MHAIHVVNYPYTKGLCLCWCMLLQVFPSPRSVQHLVTDKCVTSDDLTDWR